MFQILQCSYTASVPRRDRGHVDETDARIRFL